MKESAPNKRISCTNENSVSLLRSTFQRIDEQLTHIESVMNTSFSNSVFPRHAPDISAEQRRTIDDFIVQMRASMIQVLENRGIPREESMIPVSRSIVTSLNSVDSAIHQLRQDPGFGSGNVSGDTVQEINSASGDLQNLVTRLKQYLNENLTQDLRARIRNLDQPGDEIALLSSIEQVVAEQGLGEFRGTISLILDHAERKNFEIAIFGRISAGKSSLLNAFLGTDLLPVGMNPVTAVPTQVVFGNTASVMVSFKEGAPKKVEIERLKEFITEPQNPGNSKKVTRIVITFPSDRLKEGVTYVDTPGLDLRPMAKTHGTLSYLPACDLGIVLIDAGSKPDSRDFEIISALKKSAIPVILLLSKSDLLGAQECEETLARVKQTIAAECSLDLPVYPISTLPTHQYLMDRWIAEQVLPLYQQTRELKRIYLQKRVGALRQSVIATLQARIRGSADTRTVTPEILRSVKTRLQRASVLVEESNARCEEEIGQMKGETVALCRAAGEGLYNAWSLQEAKDVAPDAVIRSSILQCMQKPQKNIKDIIENLAIQLRNALQKSNHDLHLADLPSEDELQSLIGDVPVFDPGILHINVSRPPYGTFFGRVYTENLLAETVRRQLDKTLATALVKYSETLRQWTRSMNDQLFRRFERQADRYVAYADQMLNGQRLSGEQIMTIQNDLRILGASDHA